MKMNVKEKLQHWLKHDKNCVYEKAYAAKLNGQCTCGLNEALAALEKFNEWLVDQALKEKE